jgi:hypothetical protein
MKNHFVSEWDVVIVGGGPAGFFAAIRCAELNPQLRVLILEKAQQTLGKVIISGGGRCNVTHACFEPEKLIEFYPRGSRELRGAFTRFQPQDTIEWFQSRSVKLKTEADGRMFPITDSAMTIVDCLRESARKAGVSVETGASVSGIEQDSIGGFTLEVKSESQVVQLRTKKLCIATGGDRKTFDLIKALGHSIVEPVPSLFTFNVKDKRIDGLAGVSVEVATLKMDSVTTHGPLLITHWGLSGPAVLKCSAWGARILFEQKYAATLTVNWLGAYTLDRALEVLKHAKDRSENARKMISAQAVFSQIPLRLWKQLIEFIGDKSWAEVSKADLRKLAEELTAGQFLIEGKGQFKEEFVTCGGVNLKEVNFKTMQSRLIDGLFFAGEVLDIDGLTGGFNFQSSWTTGWLAGTALSQ